MMLKTVSTRRTSLAAKLFTQTLAQAVAFLFLVQSAWRGAKQRANALGAALAVFAMTAIGTAYAQMTSGGNTNPDQVINTAVCGANGWLTWFTSTKFLVVILVAGLIGFFIGRAIGKRDNDGIIGTLIAVFGLGCIRILVKVVTTC